MLFNYSYERMILLNLSKLPNIGKVLEKELNDVGINTAEELSKVGSIEAIKRISTQNDVCLNKLYALEGAIQKKRWNYLDEECKIALKEKFSKK